MYWYKKLFTLVQWSSNTSLCNGAIHRYRKFENHSITAFVRTIGLCRTSIILQDHKLKNVGGLLIAHSGRAFSLQAADPG